jgi:hypothetical protein
MVKIPRSCAMIADATAVTPTQIQPSRIGPIAELRASLPEHALLHEIQIHGACDWETIVSIGKVLAGSDGVLDSFSARRYGAKGELTICRLRDLDDTKLCRAVDEVRRLPGVRSVTVAHLLSAQRTHRPPGAAARTPSPEPQASCDRGERCAPPHMD